MNRLGSLFEYAISTALLQTTRLEIINFHYNSR